MIETLGCFQHRFLPFPVPPSKIVLVVSAASGSHEPSHQAGQESSPDRATARQGNWGRNGPILHDSTLGTITGDGESSANFTDGFASSSACNMELPDSGNPHCPQRSVGSTPAFRLEAKEAGISAPGGCTDGTQPSDSTGESHPLRPKRKTASFGDSDAVGQMECLPASSPQLPPDRRSSFYSNGSGFLSDSSNSLSLRYTRL